MTQGNLSYPNAPATVVEWQVKFRELVEAIALGRSVGRVPLFILGSGVSIPHVPGTSEILQRLCGHLDKLQTSDDKLAREVAGRLARDGRRMAADIMYQSRSTASHFFGTLQSDDPRLSQIVLCWRVFTEEFLLGWNERGPIWKVQPTPFHEYIASEVVRESLPGVVLSLNYDGLTAKAISSVARSVLGPEQEEFHAGRFYPCRIMMSDDDIGAYYCRSADRADWTRRLHGLIKLRGDIFSAVCWTEGCVHRSARTPIYELEGEEQHEGKDIYSRAVRCPGCGEERKIEIDFPGRNIKEEEVRRTIVALYRYVVASLSVIVVCGVSGRWDPELAQFIEYCAHDRQLPLYVLDVEPQPPLLSVFRSTKAAEAAKCIPLNFAKQFTRQSAR